MYEISEKLKQYVYTSKRMIKEILSQRHNRNIFKLLKFSLSADMKYIKLALAIEKKAEDENLHKEIMVAYNFLKQNNYLREPSDDLTGLQDDYYCAEKQKFVKILLEHSKIKTKYNIDRITFYVSMDRTFSEHGNNSPLFLLPDKLNDDIGMDGSSGYSIFKLLMDDYLKCRKCFLKQFSEKTKRDFAKDPVDFFEKHGCVVSDTREFETVYRKRSILKDDTHNIVYTFAYPVFIAKL